MPSRAKASNWFEPLKTVDDPLTLSFVTVSVVPAISLAVTPALTSSLSAAG